MSEKEPLNSPNAMPNSCLTGTINRDGLVIDQFTQGSDGQLPNDAEVYLAGGQRLNDVSLVSNISTPKPEVEYYIHDRGFIRRMSI